MKEQNFLLWKFVDSNDVRHKMFSHSMFNLANNEWKYRLWLTTGRSIINQLLTSEQLSFLIIKVEQSLSAIVLLGITCLSVAQDDIEEVMSQCS